MKTREKILLCTLKLAGEKGLGKVSLSKIADMVGIQKATLFSHFESKEDIIISLYEYLRSKSKQLDEAAFVDYDTFFRDKDAKSILMDVINSYIAMNSTEEMSDFYKLIYTERVFDAAAAEIIIEESKKMELATRNLLYAMQEHGLLQIANMQFTVTVFCCTVHELLELREDYILTGQDFSNKIEKFIIGFVDWCGKKA